MYLRGKGVPKDESAAITWFHKAAEQGQVDAEFGLGLMYESGRIVPQDKVEALKWFRKAKEHGEEMAYDKVRSMETDY